MNTVIKFELAVHQAQELYPMDLEKRQKYIEWYMHKDEDTYWYPLLKEAKDVL